MPGWLSVVIVIAVVLGVLLLKERLRGGALEKWAKAKGFRVHSPFVPEASSPAWGLAGRFTARGARRWGAAVEGSLDGVPVILAEFETTWAGARENRKWQTLAFWASEGSPGTVVVWRKVGTDLGLSVAPGGGVDERLGIETSDPESLVGRTSGGLRVEAAAAVRDRWLTDERVHALEAWAHGGEFTRDGSHAAWRRQGVLSGELIEEMAAAIPQARRILA